MESMLSNLQEALAGGTSMIWPLLFLGGLFASITPCTYPMIPLAAGYLGSKGGSSKLRLVLSGIMMAIGLAMTYAVLGVIFAALRLPFGSLQGNGYFLGGLGLFFVVMSLFLFGAFSFPRFSASGELSQEAAKQKGILGAFLYGIAGGLIVGPCTGPILLIILSFVVATLENSSGVDLVSSLFEGGAKLFVFGLAQSVLPVLCGIFSGVLASLPKSGRWLTVVNKLFASLVLIMGCLVLIHAGSVTGIDPLGRFLAFSEKATVEKVEMQFDTPAVYDLNGNGIEAKELHGEEGTIFVFFATWCPSCVAEAPAVENLYKRIQNKKLKLYGINFQQEPGIVKRFLKEKKLTYPVYIDRNADLVRQYGIEGIPAVIVLDGEGKVVYKGGEIPEQYRE